MKRHTLYLVSIFLSSLIISSCVKDKSPVSTQTFELDTFREVELSISGNVEIVNGLVQKVDITGPEKTVDLIDKSVNSGKWKIKLPNNYPKRYDELNVAITSNIIEKLVISGSGDIIGKDTLPLSSVKISGSGNIEAITNDNTLNSIISGSGKITVSGYTDELTHNQNGSGNFHGFELITTNADIKISGSGDVEVYVTDNMNITISGSGNVYYKGTPTINTNISGSGNIINKN